MRLVFYCPLTARIGHHLREFVRFKSHNAYRKYHYFISSYFNNPGREVAIFWDGQKKPDWYGYSKCFFWMLINGIKPWKVKILEKVRDLDPKNDVVMGFPFLSFNNWSLCDNSLFFTYPGLKVFHFSHYFAETEKVCSLIKNCSNTVIIADSNIQKNPLYSKYMGTHFPLYVLPFALKDRYKDTVSFSKRKPKCLAAGTKSKICHDLHREFYEVFQSDDLHPLRAEIFQKKDEIKDYIESLIYDFNENADFTPKSTYEKLIQSVTKKIGNDRRRFFSFDIVKKYNSYQMFVSPEEEIGVPSISFIEGMACGCAYLGRPEIYEGFGMVPGKHFISYNGSLEDLIKTIQYHQEHPALTAEIAHNGKRFVIENFAPNKIAINFWSFLEENVHTIR